MLLSIADSCVPTLLADINEVQPERLLLQSMLSTATVAVVVVRNQGQGRSKAHCCSALMLVKEVNCQKI
jgi:hypothetical protein